MDTERNWCMSNSVVEYTTVPICFIVDLVIHEEGLFVTSEIRPRDIINGGICSDLYRYWFGLRAVVVEHLSNLCIDIIGCIWAYN